MCSGAVPGAGHRPGVPGAVPWPKGHPQHVLRSGAQGWTPPGGPWSPPHVLRIGARGGHRPLVPRSGALGQRAPPACAPERCPGLGTARGLGVSATAQADGGARPEMGTSAGSGALPREIFLLRFRRFPSKIGIPHYLPHLVGKLTLRRRDLPENDATGNECCAG